MHAENLAKPKREGGAACRVLHKIASYKSMQILTSRTLCLPLLVHQQAAADRLAARLSEESSKTGALRQDLAALTQNHVSAFMHGRDQRSELIRGGGFLSMSAGVVSYSSTRVVTVSCLVAWLQGPMPQFAQRTQPTTSNQHPHKHIPSGQGA